jgi:RNA polymerase II subunit A small phosphatase-like protein
MQGLHYINSVPAGDEYMTKKFTLPKTEKTKLAIFDMDETLIHCIPDRHLHSDTGSSAIKQTDVVLKFNYSDCVETLPVNIRPYIKECIMEIKKEYQVIVFTASKKEYADTILDYIDPDGTLIEAR